MLQEKRRKIQAVRAIFSDSLKPILKKYHAFFKSYFLVETIW
jgi:hypothetical protein